jgi:hypothetical protein
LKKTCLACHPGSPHVTLFLTGGRPWPV